MDPGTWFYLLWFIGLYQSVENQLTGVADLYANMGDVTKALGMDKISIATLEGLLCYGNWPDVWSRAGMFASMLGLRAFLRRKKGIQVSFIHLAI